jgi:hypothetical protein
MSGDREKNVVSRTRRRTVNSFYIELYRFAFDASIDGDARQDCHPTMRGAADESKDATQTPFVLGY